MILLPGLSSSAVQKRVKMKRVGSIKQALRPTKETKSNGANNDAVNNNESHVNGARNNSSKMNSSFSSSVSNGLSILGNFGPPKQNEGSKPDFHLPKSISSFLKAGKGTLTRNKKEKSTNQVSFHEQMVFCFENCTDLLWEKIVRVMKKNFWNSRQKAKNLQKKFSQ